MPPRKVIVFAQVSRALRKSPFWSSFKKKVEDHPRGMVVEISSPSKNLDLINETISNNLRRGELAVMLGIRKSTGKGDWSQIRHFTPARHSARLSQYLAGKLKVAPIPSTVTRFNAEYGPTDVERNREAREFVNIAFKSGWRAVPMVILPWFSDNPKQRESIENDTPNMEAFGAALADGCIAFIERWS
jgi:hypothetical protein